MGLSVARCKPVAYFEKEEEEEEEKKKKKKKKTYNFLIDYHESRPTTLCSKKGSHQTFDSNFVKS